jgi:cytoskeletal protein RodZ
MELVGAKLKKIRLEKGFSLEEINKKTKIHLNVLKAIEEGSVGDLNPVYLRSFIKIYCKFLGVDYKDFIADYRFPHTSVKYTPAPNVQSDKPVSFIPSASTKMGSLRSYRKIKLSTVIIIVAAVLFLFGVFSLGKFIASRRGKTPPKRASASRIAPVKTGSEARFQKPQIIPTGSAGSIAGVKLTISAREDCWIKVKSDGKLLYYGILKKGRFDSWQAKGKINLYLSNAGAVDLNVNGQVITSLGRKNQTIGDIVITKEGLSVQQ